MIRHKARETAFQMLFQLVEGANDWQLAENTLAEADLPTKASAFAAQLAKGAWQKHFETEQYIRRLAKGWQYERLCSVDRLVLHLAMYELKYLPENPPPIVIDEAVELARSFGTDDSSSFVNAVLDKFVHVVLSPEEGAEYQLNEAQIRQAEERLQQTEAAKAAEAADVARAAEQAWAEKPWLRSGRLLVKRLKRKLPNILHGQCRKHRWAFAKSARRILRKQTVFCRSLMRNKRLCMN